MEFHEMIHPLPRIALPRRGEGESFRETPFVLTLFIFKAALNYVLARPGTLTERVV